MTSPGTAASLRRAHSSGRRKWDEPVPPILRPLVRAYILGYASSVGPRLVTLILQVVAAARKPTPVPDADRDNAGLPPRELFASSLRRILRSGFDPRRFPTFCAALIGGTTILERVLRRLLPRLFSHLTEAAIHRISRILASFAAAWFSLRLLQSKHSESYSDVEHVEGPDPLSGPKVKITRYAGRTLDLTLFAACRAIDVVVGELWDRRRKRRVAAGTWTRVESSICKFIDSALFAASCALIMWAWFYHPAKLPRAYRKWISSAAAVDPRLIKALRRCRAGELRYGEDDDGGVQAGLLQPMCAEYGWPAAWGDPAVAVPFPCEMVHMGAGPSCERHALGRFARSFKWAMATYLPLNLLVIARASPRRRNTRALAAAIASAARSSAFLGAFIALFYYGVCLARTRVGPHIVSPGPDPDPAGAENEVEGESAQARARARRCQRIDGGLCVGAGCALCGWSILLERPGRVANMALFVAPRALATLLPRRYPLAAQWRETLAFALSAAVVLPCARENPARVRGVLGKLLRAVLEP